MIIILKLWSDNCSFGKIFLCIGVFKCLHFVVQAGITGNDQSLTGFWTGCKISKCTVERFPRGLPRYAVVDLTLVTNGDWHSSSKEEEERECI